MVQPNFVSRTPHEVCVNAAALLACTVDGSVRVLASEHIRTLVYINTIKHFAGMGELIHTSRILSNLKANLSYLSQGNESSIVELHQGILEEARLFGDACDIGGGRWISAPLNFFETPNSNFLLTIGTTPSALFQELLNISPIPVGMGRLVPKSIAQQATKHGIVSSFDRWIGEYGPLKSWTEAIIASIFKSRSEIDAPPHEALEVYDPTVAHARGVRGRWAQLDEVDGSVIGPRLVRPRIGYAKIWDRPYYLAQFDMCCGTLKLKQLAKIPRPLVYRLCFGFDLLLGTRRTGEYIGRDTSIVLELRFGLPEPHNRVTSLAEKIEKLGSQHTAFTFALEAWPFVQAAMADIGVVLRAKKREIK